MYLQSTINPGLFQISVIFQFILNNINGEQNLSSIGNYEDDILMMMYDDVVIKRLSEL